MTGDISQLNDVQNFDGGYVNFTGDKGGRITKKGTVTNGTLCFEDVLYVEELQHSLLSVDQICDKNFTTFSTTKNVSYLNQVLWYLRVGY